MTTHEIRAKIEQQKASNKKLFDSIPTASHADPMNKRADPILIEWRKGLEILQEFLKELQEIELQDRELSKAKNAYKWDFVNGFGETTEREITTTLYEQSQKRLSREIMLLCGGR